LSDIVAGQTSVCLGNTTPLTATGSGGNGGPYTFTWSPPSGLNTTSGSTVNANPTVTTTYTVTVSDGCTTPDASTTVTVTVLPLPVATFGPDTAKGCAPLGVRFTHTGPNDSCFWNFGNGIHSNNCSDSIVYTNAGSYVVTLTVKGADGCTTTLTKNAVTVYPDPEAAFSMSPQPALITSPTISFTDLSTPVAAGNSWYWSFGDVTHSTSVKQNPQFTYSDSGKYTAMLILTDIHGCKDSAIQTVIILPEMEFYVPNAFTPNGDGINDVFMPKGTDIDPNDYEMDIFDRWGDLIFQTNDLMTGWDGRANGGPNISQIDVYVWRISVRGPDKARHIYTGSVSLIK
ncbi:MAG TPA: PKD domain-containing protein, partial [Bacteroidia bacterium]|nr:PKD domain-containing protein [Bacteroidia bacterium]